MLVIDDFDKYRVSKREVAGFDSEQSRLLYNLGFECWDITQMGDIIKSYKIDMENYVVKAFTDLDCKTFYMCGKINSADIHLFLTSKGIYEIQVLHENFETIVTTKFQEISKELSLVKALLMFFHTSELLLYDGFTHTYVPRHDASTPKTLSELVDYYENPFDMVGGFSKRYTDIFKSLGYTVCTENFNFECNNFSITKKSVDNFFIFYALMDGISYRISFCKYAIVCFKINGVKDVPVYKRILSNNEDIFYELGLILDKFKMARLYGYLP